MIGNIKTMNVRDWEYKRKKHITWFLISFLECITCFFLACWQKTLTSIILLIFSVMLLWVAISLNTEQNLRWAKHYNEDNEVGKW